MAQTDIVVQGATLKCQFGFQPDTMKVYTHEKHYANDNDGATKLIATDKDIGMTLESNSFGKCKMQPTLGGYLPCVPALTRWEGVYEDAILSNGGKVLLETSQCICSIAGSACVSFTNSGQVAEPSPQNFENADTELLLQVFPLVDMSNFRAENPYQHLQIK